MVLTKSLLPIRQASLEQSDLIQKRVLEEVQPEVRGLGVYSPVFLVPKPSGDWRMILDLRYQNRFIRKKRFRMENIHSVILGLAPGDLMATLDLNEAYLHIPIFEPHRKYLRIAVFLEGEITHLQFTAVPFGITSAPFVFTKVVLTVVAVLKLQNIQIIPYLDDWLIMAHSAGLLRDHLSTTFSLLQKLGWLINWEKSCIVPATAVKFLGFVLDSQSMTLSLSLETRKGKLSEQQ